MALRIYANVKPAILVWARYRWTNVHIILVVVFERLEDQATGKRGPQELDKT